jgi:hypothetical protein
VLPLSERYRFLAGVARLAVQSNHPRSASISEYVGEEFNDLEGSAA